MIRSFPLPHILWAGNLLNDLRVYLLWGKNSWKMIGILLPGAPSSRSLPSTAPFPPSYILFHVPAIYPASSKIFYSYSFNYFLILHTWISFNACLIDGLETFIFLLLTIFLYQRSLKCCRLSAHLSTFHCMCFFNWHKLVHIVNIAGCYTVDKTTG